MPGLAALTRRHVVRSILATSLLASPALAQAPVEPPATPAAHHPPLSAASGVLIVEPRRSPDSAAIPESDAQLERRIQTHVATLASEHLMRRVVNDSPGSLRETKWFGESGGDANERAAWLRDHCRIAAVPGTSLIEIALPDVKDANERKEILIAVGSLYMHERMQGDALNLKDRTAVLSGLREKAKSRLTLLVSEKQQAQQKLNSDGSVGGRLGAKEIELSRLVAEQIEATMKAGKAQAEYESIQAALREGQPVPGQQNQVAPNLQNAERELQQLEVEVAVGREQLGPNNPRVLALEKRLEATRAGLAKKKEGAEAALATARRQIAEQAKAEAEAAKATADGLTKRVEALKGELGELSNATLTLLSLQEEERGLKEQVKLVQEQIDRAVAAQPAFSTGTDIRWHLLPQAADR